MVTFIMVVCSALLMPFALLGIIATAFLLLLLWFLVMALVWELGRWLFAK